MKFLKTILIGLAVFAMAMATAFAQDINSEALALIKGERYNDARQKIESGMQADEKNPGWDYLKGLLHYTLEEYTQAETAFKSGIDKKSKFAFNHIGLARSYNMLKKADERDQVIEKVKALNKKNLADINLELTTALVEAERGDEAKIILYKLRDEIPDNAEVWRKLAEYYMARRVYQLAEKNYEKVLELDPNDVDAMLALGQINIKLREFEKGLKFLNKAIKLKEDLAPAYKERAELYRLWGDYDQAKQKALYDQATKDMEKYISLLPNDTRAQYRYAQFLYLSGNYEKAIEELNKAQTDSYVKDRLLAYCLIGIGKYDEGKAKFDEYWARVPEDKRVKEDYEALGNYYMGKADYEKAIENFRKMLEMEAEQNPDNARDADDFFEEMAKSFKKKKDYQKEMIFRQAMINEKVANGIDVPFQRYYNLGLAAYRAQDYEASKTAYDKVIELEPTNAQANFWAGSCVYKIEGSDAEGWPVAPYYSKYIELMTKDGTEGLDGSDKKYVQSAAVYMAFARFNPTQSEDAADYQCEAAMEYINLVLELDPENTQVSSINDYCSQTLGTDGN
jgi:tetratricopeptide (TPR) repeat protein